MSAEASKKRLTIQEELAQQGILEDKQESFDRAKNLPIEHQLKAEPGEPDQHSSLVRPASIYPVNSFFTFVNWPWRALSTSWFEMPPKKATILPGTNDYCTKTNFNFNMTPYTYNRDLLAAIALLPAREPFDFRRKRNRRRTILGGG
jgi:hypothetical protein